MKQLPVLNLFLLLLFYSCNNTISYYVSPTGDDENPGSLEQPFATLDKAKEATRKEKNRSVTIYVREGIYYLDKPVVFTERAGSDTQSINATELAA